MPFVAMLDLNEQIDATYVERDVWESIHRASPRRDLRCPECRGQMHAKVRGGLRFFAHDRLEDCTTADESAAHQRLKLAVGTAIRQAGWEALFEERVDSRRADVVALPPANSSRLPIAFEVQLSPQTRPVTTERTNDYAASGLDTIWVVRNQKSIGSTTHARLDVTNDEGALMGPYKALGFTKRTVSPRPPIVVHLDKKEPVWTTVMGPATLAPLLTEIFAGRMVWHPEASAWVPAGEPERHARALAAFSEARLAALGIADARDVATWRTGATQSLGEAAAAAGHRMDVLQHSVQEFAGASLVHISGQYYGISPAPERLTTFYRGNLHRFLAAVIVATPEEADILRSYGVKALLPDDVPLPPADENTHEVDEADPDRISRLREELLNRARPSPRRRGPRRR